jgi:hypothetical protein
MYRSHSRMIRVALLYTALLAVTPVRSGASSLVSADIDQYVFARVGVPASPPAQQQQEDSFVGPLPTELPGSQGVFAKGSTRVGASALSAYASADLSIWDGAPGVDPFGDPIPADPTLLLAGWHGISGSTRDKDPEGIRGTVTALVSALDVIEISLPSVAQEERIVFDVSQSGHDGAVAPLLHVNRLEKTIALFRTSTGETIYSMSSVDYDYPFDPTRIDLTPYAGETLRMELAGELDVFGEEGWGLPSSYYHWGIETGFEFRLVPEPSSALLLAAGTLGLTCWRRRA